MNSSENTSAVGLSEVVQNILRWLNCRGSLRQDATGLVCPKCNRLYPLTNGVYRFVDVQKYAGSFCFQWKRYSRTQCGLQHVKVIEQPIAVRGRRPPNPRLATPAPETAEVERCAE